ncbi:MAG: DUF1232 domain-containing protein [Bosea sp.]|uniref:YkvA family protein n=1 Tax=Bosea sp. (in: a-proteobacteria) TaxID=1871050 RepID=UPI001AC2126C|nr:YkvA family protein [Bosea sp. (in: a-proteobacteria)]MBN9452362.1 DUF1232 domain-containing protein [Bosea sp. (in: a-proteobacteria)]
MALWIAARDSRTPWHAKLVAGLVAAYALSPIDLIPDFIPILGYLDDLIIVPIGILLVVKLIPEPLMAEYRAMAAEQARQTSYGGMIAILAIWIAIAAALLWSAWPGGTR